MFTVVAARGDDRYNNIILLSLQLGLGSYSNLEVLSKGHKKGMWGHLTISGRENTNICYTVMNYWDWNWYFSNMTRSHNEILFFSNV